MSVTPTRAAVTATKYTNEKAVTGFLKDFTQFASAEDDVKTALKAGISEVVAEVKNGPNESKSYIAAKDISSKFVVGADYHALYDVVCKILIWFIFYLYFLIFFSV